MDFLVTIIELLRFLYESYLTTSGITMQTLKTIVQFLHDQINEKSQPLRTDRPTLIIKKLRF